MHNYFFAEANAVQSILSPHNFSVSHPLHITVFIRYMYVISQYLVIPVFVPACGEFGAEYTPPIVKLLVFF